MILFATQDDLDLNLNRCMEGRFGSRHCLVATLSSCLRQPTDCQVRIHQKTEKCSELIINQLQRYTEQRFVEECYAEGSVVPASSYLYRDYLKMIRKCREKQFSFPMQRFACVYNIFEDWDVKMRAQKTEE